MLNPSRSSSSSLTSLATSPPTSPSASSKNITTLPHDAPKLTTTCWIERLPDELLLMIFENLVSTNQPSEFAKLFLWPSTLVCRRWSVYAQRVMMYNISFSNRSRKRSRLFGYFTRDSIRTKLRVRHLSIDTSERDPDKIFLPTLRKFISPLSHVRVLELLLYLPYKRRALKRTDDWREFRKIIVDGVGSHISCLILDFRPGMEGHMKPRISDQLARLLWSLPNLQRLEFYRTDFDTLYPTRNSNGNFSRARSNKLKVLMLAGHWTRYPPLLRAFDLTGLKRFSLWSYDWNTGLVSFPMDYLTDEKWSFLERLEVPLMKNCSSVEQRAYLSRFPNVKSVHLWAAWDQALDSILLTYLPSTVAELNLDFFHLNTQQSFLYLDDRSVLPALRVLNIRLLRENADSFGRSSYEGDCFENDFSLRATCERRQVALTLIRGFRSSDLCVEWTCIFR